MHEPDPEVIRSAASGDAVAFEKIVRAYQAHVWRFLRHLLGDPALAEDITQETFIRVYHKLETFRFRSKFSSWIFQVARNAGIDALRARKRRDRLRLAVEHSSRHSIPANHLRVEIEEALSSLPPKLREAFVLVEAMGFTYREAGVTLSIPEGTVKSRVFHARKRLVSWLSAGEDTDDES